MSLLVGHVIAPMAHGEFGRDDYHPKRVEAVGADWVVARDLETGEPMFASGPHVHDNLADRIEVLP